PSSSQNFLHSCPLVLESHIKFLVLFHYGSSALSFSIYHLTPYISYLSSHTYSNTAHFIFPHFIPYLLSRESSHVSHLINYIFVRCLHDHMVYQKLVDMS